MSSFQVIRLLKNLPDKFPLANLLISGTTKVNKAIPDEVLEVNIWIKHIQEDININKRSRYVTHSIILAALLIIFITGCVEKYNKQGHALSKELNNHLMKQGFCTSKNCKRDFEIFGGHGNRVNFSIYNPKDKKVLASIIEYVVEHGLQVTGGVPISIYVYPKSRKEYGNFLFRPETILKLEVTK